MKNFAKFLLMFALVGLFFSCEKDDNGENDNQDPLPTHIKISYSYENTADFFRYVNTEVTYLDKNGVEKKESVKNNKWSYEETLEYKSAPTNYACKLFLTKTGVEPETEKCSMMGYGHFNVVVSAIYADGNTKNLGSSQGGTTTAGQGDIVAALNNIGDQGKVLCNFTYSITK